VTRTLDSAGLRLLEIVERSQTGPPCKETDFDIKLLGKKLEGLVKEYDIKYDPANPMPADNSLADDLYEAGLRLFLDLGIFCMDKQTLIKFDDAEVKACLRDLIPEVVLGAGRDARRLKRREVEDPTPPTLFGGPFGGLLSPGRPFVDAMTSMAKEPIISMLYYGSLEEIEGRRVIGGSPIELHAARCESRWMREAAARAGRPGMHLVGSAALSAAAEIANSDPVSGYRPTDGRNACLLTSLKIDYNTLNKVKHFLDYSTFIYTYYVDLVGGYAGPEGTAITAVASHLANMIINQATYQAICIVDIHEVNTTNRKCVWAQNIVGQAIARNTKIITFHTCMPSSGPCTEVILYEAAAIALGVPAGVNLLGVMGTGSKLKDRYTGLEQRFYGETGYAATRLRREDANELTKQMLERYEGSLKSPNRGKTLQECYNIETLKPKQEWLEIYEKVKRELTDLGLNI